MLRFSKELCDDNDIVMNKAVYESEMSTCSRNRAIAYLLESKNIIESDVEDSLRFYTKMCSLDVTSDPLWIQRATASQAAGSSRKSQISCICPCSTIRTS